MKFLISACVYGKDVRWNGSDRSSTMIHEWAEQNDITLVPVCPEDNLFGSPRKPIRMMYAGENISANMGSDDVLVQIRSECRTVADQFCDVDGFIGIAKSPTCGMSVGVKNLGKTIKGFLHQELQCPTTEINSMRNESDRNIFLKRCLKNSEAAKK